MHVASSVPKQHVTSGNGIDVVAKIPIRTENDLFIRRETFYDLAGVARSDHHIRDSLGGSRSIDVRDDRMAGMS